MTQSVIAIILLIVGIALVFGFLSYKRSTSKKRMMRMLVRVGLDPELVNQGDTRAIMKEVRQRCSRCQSEDVCERWLAGTSDVGNQFCPNAKVFEELKRA
jgi:hypothetical protein